MLLYFRNSEIYLMPYTMGLYTALAFAKTEPQIVKSGVILVVSKIPAKLITRYGVHAMNHREMVIRATYIIIRALFFVAHRSELRNGLSARSLPSPIYIRRWCSGSQPIARKQHSSFLLVHACSSRVLRRP